MSQAASATLPWSLPILLLPLLLRCIAATAMLLLLLLWGPAHLEPGVLAVHHFRGAQQGEAGAGI